MLRLVFGYSMRLLGIGGTAFVLLIGLLGAFFPALRAARVDPVAALRSEN
ncbi:MAG: hypothetical protein GWO83_00460 [Bacteroidia bacterium]|nr:hypothetical protein [Bacteroidia bacterium]